MKRTVLILMAMMLLCSSCAKPDKNAEYPRGMSWSAAQQEIERLRESQNKEELKTPDPVVYQPVTIERDETLKDEQREFFFDFAQKYRLDFLPALPQEGLPDFMQMKWYIAYVASDAWVKYENGYALTADTINQITEDYFGFTYDLGGETRFPLEIGETIPTVFCELISYGEESTPEGEILVTARFVEYSYDAFSHIDPVKDDYEEYVAARHRIVTGQEDQQYAKEIIEVQYTTKDGLSLDRILSRRSAVRTPEGFSGL